MDIKAKQYLEEASRALACLRGYLDAKEDQSKINRSKLRMIKEIKPKEKCN